MNCEACFHFDVCKACVGETGIPEHLQDAGGGCRGFLDRGRVLVLPCRRGARVYRVSRIWNGAVIISEWTVDSVTVDVSETRVLLSRGEREVRRSASLDEFGVSVFTDPAEAEGAKERLERTGTSGGEGNT